MENKIKNLNKLTIDCILNDFIFRITEKNKHYCSLGKENNKVDCNYFNKTKEGFLCEYE